MDYGLVALKLLSGQLKDAWEISSQNAMTLGGILFQRAWLQVFLAYLLQFYLRFTFNPFSPLSKSFPFLQGILISNDDDDKLLLDDGTGIVELSLSADFRQRQWKTGLVFPLSFPILVLGLVHFIETTALF